MHAACMVHRIASSHVLDFTRRRRCAPPRAGRPAPIKFFMFFLAARVTRARCHRRATAQGEIEDREFVFKNK
jgi:hypothetical protein